MPMYTFNICNALGVAIAFETHEQDYDAATFTKAGQLLEEHASCDHVEVWCGDRAVLGRYRDQPVIRPVHEPGLQS